MPNQTETPKTSPLTLENWSVELQCRAIRYTEIILMVRGQWTPESVDRLIEKLLITKEALSETDGTEGAVQETGEPETYADFYIGEKQNGDCEIFSIDKETTPTPESTGYRAIEGPFDN